jgi:hypothetical protein
LHQFLVKKIRRSRKYFGKDPKELEDEEGATPKFGGLRGSCSKTGIESNRVWISKQFVERVFPKVTKKIEEKLLIVTRLKVPFFNADVARNHASSRPMESYESSDDPSLEDDIGSAKDSFIPACLTVGRQTPRLFSPCPCPAIVLCFLLVVA